MLAVYGVSRPTRMKVCVSLMRRRQGRADNRPGSARGQWSAVSSPAASALGSTRM